MVLNFKSNLIWCTISEQTFLYNKFCYHVCSIPSDCQMIQLEVFAEHESLRWNADYIPNPPITGDDVPFLEDGPLEKTSMITGDT